MDEPLAALDAAAKDAILPHLERLQRELEIPIVYVSHSIDEVARLADTVVWLDAGQVRATGTAASLLGRLDFGQALGEEALSFIEARILEHDDRYQLTQLESVWGSLWTHWLAAPPGESVRLRVQARDVSLSLTENSRTSVLNSLPAIVSGAERSAGEMLVRLSHPGGDEVLLARITLKSYEELGLAEGTQLWARIKAVSVR
jgi:molybdate transport system ATP-binding protein